MDAATLLLIMAIAGVNFGWQPAPDGAPGYEYIVQVEPELVDAVKRGDSIPIESNIPQEVTPIRKVRVVVGRGELPREPLRHTANFAGQAGWAPDRYPSSTAAPNADRYPAQAPSLLNRTETAITETGSAISDGVQAGMRSAQEKFSRAGNQVMSDTQNAAQEFGKQLQQWSDSSTGQLQSAGNSVRSATEQTFETTGNQIRQAGSSLGLTGGDATSSRTGGVSAPPWPSATASSGGPQEWPTNPAPMRGQATDTTSSPGMAVTRTATGWTSIGTNVAAPPLLNPPLTTSADNRGSLRIAQNATTGPSLSPPASTSSREPLHSVLIDPSRQQTTNSAGTNDWANSSGTGAAAPATIGRTGNSSRASDAANSGLVPVQPRYPSQQNTQQAADRWGDPWAETDPWKQPSQQPQQNASPQPPANTNSSGTFATNNGWSTNTPASTPAAASVTGDQPIINHAPPTNSAAGFGANPGQQGIVPQGTNLAGTNPAGGPAPPNAGAATQPPPWLPLLLVTLGLVGSLSANFYLVLSYIGARQRYVSLVQKTADTFRRAAGAAATA